MGNPTPTLVGCAAVSWVNGNALAIRVFYRDTEGRLIMSTYDNPDMNNKSKIPAWTATVPEINGAPIKNLFNGWKDSITAVSVHPNTNRHEIHVFYMASAQGTDRQLQSAILDVTNGKWFMDNRIGALNSDACPSAAVGWEDGTKNAFRLYFCKEKDWSFFKRTSEVREIAFDNGNWYLGNDNKPIDTFDENNATGDSPASIWRSRVAACTWLDAAGVRQIRVYRSDVDEKFRELIYKPADNKWFSANWVGTKCFGSRGQPLAAVTIKSANGVGIRQYSYQARTQSGGGTWPQVEKGNMTWKECGFDESSKTWFEQKLPIDAANLFVMAPTDPIEWRKIPFSVTSWNWPDSSRTSIRIYRVTTIDNKPEAAYISESAFDSHPNNQWSEVSARF